MVWFSSMEQSPYQAEIHSAGKKIPHLLWTQRFIIMFTRAHHWNPMWASWIQFTPSHPMSLGPTLILSSVSQVSSLFKVFQQNYIILLSLQVISLFIVFQSELCKHFLSLPWYKWHWSHPPWIEHNNGIGGTLKWQNIVWKASICQSSCSSHCGLWLLRKYDPKIT